MPEFLIVSPFKWNGEIKQQGLITLTAEEAEPMVCSGSLVPVVDGLELSDSDQLFTLDELTGEMKPVSASELQTLVVDSVTAGKCVYVVAEGRTVEHNGKSFTERQFMLLAPEDAAPLIELGDVITMAQLAEIMRQAELAEDQQKADEEARLAEEKRKADEAARLAQEQKDNKRKAKGDAAQS
ncbi:MAG: hypothetical protein E6Q75_02515 [Rheinheimera sp.]|nr:MAG: hypothetical protein E6Q75_02515 [Rheinheimera sp.]